MTPRLFWSPRPLVLTLGLAVCAALGCSPLRTGEGDGEDGMQMTDGGGTPPPYTNESGCKGTYCDAMKPCGGGRRCVQNVCFVDNGACQSDNECQSDTRCHMGSCIPWDACSKLTPYDPSCMGQVFTPGEFKPPVTTCKLEGFQSLSIPVVADLDKDGKPEIITIAYSNTVIAIRGDDCKERFRKVYPSLLSSGQGSVAVADLDGDGFGEIVVVTGDQRVMVLDKDGTVLATSPTPAQETSPYGQQLWSAPAIVDVDGKAPPEIIAGAQVSRFLRGPNRIEVLWTKPNRGAFWGSLPIAADLDGDGVPEVISSDKIYDGLTGADKTPADLASKPFYAQTGDFNGDKKPDLVLVMSERGKQIVSVYDFAAKKTLFGPYTVAEGGWGGPAVVADFDGDKVPDFGLASAQHYFVYALKCARNPKPADCKGTDPGVLWAKNTNDASSGGTGSSVFDFNGDGIAEVVYRDECWLRVYNGPDGKTLFAANVTSATCLELPVIADVNNDGHADIVVTSDNIGACQVSGRPEAETMTPWTGNTSGIHVLRDPMNRWMPSRPLWNQHAYHITNINDDLSVPLAEKDNWLNYNNYRQNVQGGPMGSGSLPDGTGKPVPAPDNTNCMSVWRLQGQICNRGGGPMAAPLYGTFYDGHPDMGGKVACTTQTDRVLQPGECQTVSCPWNNPPQGARDIYLRVGDDGKGNRAGGQCKNGNDLSVLRSATCGGGFG